MKKSLFKEFETHLNDIIIGYEESHIHQNYDSKVMELLKIFKNEYGSPKIITYEKGVKNAFTYWLNGLPSAINILYTYYDIENFWKSIDITLWNTIKDMDFSKLYRLYIFETINNKYDITSYIYNCIELENIKRTEVLENE